MFRKPELLAPAGSFESLRGAINAGADAVYLGGKLFSARAYATNFDEEELKRAINYCHIHGVNIYLTINTLLKNNEIESLYDYVLPYYKEGLDGVILQDFGVLNFLKQSFPDLPLHGSTQMNAHNYKDLEVLKNLGLQRVVLAREVTLEEIEDIKSKTNIEIETFVHGALCYCYSGQCLMSSILGGRSGNRGKCAQPCRLPYTLNSDALPSRESKNKYLLSPKDINTLEIIPELIDRKIDSFKIEGRMKGPEYVSGVTNIYRRVIDEYIEKGSINKNFLNKDIDTLLELFNRGGFSKGYYLGKHNEDMLAIDKPKHLGNPIGKVTKVSKSKITVTLSEDVNKDDVIEIGETTDIQEKLKIENDTKMGSSIVFLLKKQISVDPLNLVAYRTKNMALIKNLKERFIENDKKVNIEGSIVCKKDKPLYMSVAYDNYILTNTGPIVEKAKNQPLLMKKIEEQVKKTGNTLFNIDTLDVQMDEDIFIPISVINKQRRDLLEELEVKILKDYKRSKEMTKPSFTKAFVTNNEKKKNLIVAFDNLEKALIGVEAEGVDSIYVEAGPSDLGELLSLVNAAHSYKKKIYLLMPHIYRKATNKSFAKFIESLKKSHIDGFVIKTLGQYYDLEDSSKELILDYNLYAINNYAVDEWEQLDVSRYTLSPELHYKEMSELPLERYDLIAYGYLPLMVSDQCVIKNVNGCHKNSNDNRIIDRYKKEFRIKSNCNYCYNTIYNSSPTMLLDQLKKTNEMGINNIRLHFTFEENDEVKRIIKSYVNVFKYNKEERLDLVDFNRGHFLRGVE
ncbi:putative protease [Natranaerovirga pectinivora]|uniref:Putative protease n=1 Tax=Natranaerovirga pectinivora TaxID=682400 RepID=A0A4R3MRF2_9FIRM|nr:U32 family peptidase [Natranaerovirga pectinivora]TCT17093.1 putative protease [Natranaerovirga pectinivora]